MWNYLAFDVNYSQFLVAQAVFVAVPKLSLNTAKYDLRDTIKTFLKFSFGNMDLAIQLENLMYFNYICHK